jgi:hypothetical protein
LGANKQKILELLKSTSLEIIKLWILNKEFTKNY